MPSGEKKIKKIQDLSSLALSQFKKKPHPWKPEIQLFRHFPKLQIAHFKGKNLSISLKLNITPNTLDCYWLKRLAIATKKKPVQHNFIIRNYQFGS